MSKRWNLEGLGVIPPNSLHVTGFKTPLLLLRETTHTPVTLAAPLPSLAHKQPTSTCSKRPTIFTCPPAVTKKQRRQFFLPVSSRRRPPEEVRQLSSPRFATYRRVQSCDSPFRSLLLPFSFTSATINNHRDTHSSTAAVARKQCRQLCLFRIAVHRKPPRDCHRRPFYSLLR